jgi:glutathione S-transferase
MLLYDGQWAPNPRRVRIFLAEKGIEIERTQIDLRSGEQLGAAFLAINPSGTIPALRLDDGTLIDDSVAICRYFEALQPDPPLFGRDPLAIAMIERWTRWVEAEGYQAVVAVFRNANPAFADRPLPGPRPLMPQIAALADSEWLAGDAYSFADITALIAVDFAKAARLPPAIDHAAIARWHQAMSARPSTAA